MRRFSTLNIVLLTALISLITFRGGWLAAATITSREILARFAAVFTPKRYYRPEVKFSVMSFCPYSQEIESVIRPVYDILKSSADFTPLYLFQKVANIDNYCQSRYGSVASCPSYVDKKIFQTLAECQTRIREGLASCLNSNNYLRSVSGALYTSSGGRAEASLSVRQLCAWQSLGDDKTPWWNFVEYTNKNCTIQNADTCWQDQARKAGLNPDQITGCFTASAFKIIESQILDAAKYQIDGSPAMMINGVHYPPDNAGVSGFNRMLIGDRIFPESAYRTPETIKTAVCASYKSAPSACKTKLSEVAGGAPARGGCSNL